MSSPSDPFAGLRRKLRSRSPRRVPAPPGAQTSVALILAPASTRDFAALLMERVKDPRDPWSGHISLPGGRWQDGDSDRLTTSIRETKEETGARLRPEDLIGELDDLSPRTATYPELTVRPFLFGLHAKPTLAPGPEAADCFWARFKSLRDGYCEETFLIAGKPRRLPAIKIGSRTIWGITYRILTSFLEIWDA